MVEIIRRETDYTLRMIPGRPTAESVLEFSIPVRGCGVDSALILLPTEPRDWQWQYYPLTSARLTGHTRATLDTHVPRQGPRQCCHS
jgi:hypothetical protein